MDHNALQSWHATMHKFITSMECCGLGMRQCAIHNATIQKTTFFESEVYSRVENCKVEILSHLQEESQLITFNEILL